MKNIGSIFKNQSPWGSAPGSGDDGRNGSGTRREPPNLDDLIRNFQKLINNNDFLEGDLNQDPASVAYKALEKFTNEKYDYLIIDTAGRLSNNTNLININWKRSRDFPSFVRCSFCDNYISF